MGDSKRLQVKMGDVTMTQKKLNLKFRFFMMRNCKKNIQWMIMGGDLIKHIIKTKQGLLVAYLMIKCFIQGARGRGKIMSSSF